MEIVKAYKIHFSSFSGGTNLSIKKIKYVRQDLLPSSNVKCDVPSVSWMGL